MPEKTDVSLRGLLAGAAIILAGIVLSVVGAALIAFNVRAPAGGPREGKPPAIEGARLQTSAPQDLRSYLREKNARLESFGRVDRDHFHIPIERAMQILAKGRRP